jgi:hypothetical protein
MRTFVTCMLILGPAVLLVIGFLSVFHDLLSRNVVAAPFLPNDDSKESAEDAELRTAFPTESRIDDLTVPEWAIARRQTMALSSRQHAGAARD